jgi:hypothetical protein
MRKIENVLSIVAILITVATVAALTGCAGSTQVTSVTAATASAVEAPADTAPTPVEVDALLEEYDTDGDGWAWIPPNEPRVVVGNPHHAFSSEEVEVEGSIVRLELTGETVRLADGRIARIERLAGGSVSCTVGQIDCSWDAPENSAVDSGRQVTPSGVVLTLPEPAASRIRTALAAR